MYTNLPIILKKSKLEAIKQMLEGFFLRALVLLVYYYFFYLPYTCKN